MTLATVGGFVNVSLDKVFIMPGDEGEPVDWPIVPRLIDLIVEYRVLYLQRPRSSQGDRLCLKIQRGNIPTSGLRGHCKGLRGSTVNQVGHWFMRRLN